MRVVAGNGQLKGMVLKDGFDLGLSPMKDGSDPRSDQSG